MGGTTASAPPAGQPPITGGGGFMATAATIGADTVANTTPFWIRVITWACGRNPLCVEILSGAAETIGDLGPLIGVGTVQDAFPFPGKVVPKASQSTAPKAGQQGNVQACKERYAADLEWCGATFADNPPMHLFCADIADLNVERCLDGQSRVNPDPRSYPGH